MVGTVLKTQHEELVEFINLSLDQSKIHDPEMNEVKESGGVEIKEASDDQKAEVATAAPKLKEIKVSKGKLLEQQHE